MNKQEFIQKAIKVHGNKYDYSKVDYKNNKIKICIICPVHGEFWQRPNSHLSGRGCPKCGGSKKLTKEEFILRSNSKHNNFYNYDKVIYTNVDTKVTITCPNHGDFIQTPSMHMQGQGCPECRRNKISVKKSYNNEKFIQKAKEIHGDLYNYDKVVYRNIYSPIIIECQKHGDFIQIPHTHLRGHGCPYCRMSLGEKMILQYMIINNLNYVTQFLVKDDILTQKYALIDFKIEFNNQIYFIEYNGIQHYYPVERFGGEIKFAKQIERDAQIKQYCLNNNIIFLEFDYTQSKSSIYENLDSIFKHEAI